MWSDKTIRRGLYESTRPIAYVEQFYRMDRFGPIQDEQIQPASLDVRLSNEFIRHPDGQKFELAEGRKYRLSPGECVLGCLVESVDIPAGAVARIEGKSSWARQFLTVHSAGFIDPGFSGDVTMELKNDGMLRLDLEPGVPIAQISFEWLDEVPLRTYGNEELRSHYQGQRGPTAPWKF